MTKFSNFQGYTWAGSKGYFYIDLKHKTLCFCTKLYPFLHKIKEKKLKKTKKNNMFLTPLGLFCRKTFF